MPAGAFPTNALSVEGWFFVETNPDTDADNNWRWVMNKGGWGGPIDVIMEQGRNLTVSTTLEGETIKRYFSGVQLDLAAWTHLTITVDPTTGLIQIFKNGALAGSYNIGVTGQLISNTGNFNLSEAKADIGPNGSGAFPGYMDEIAIYGRILTADEIALRYASGAPVPAPATVIPEPATLAMIIMIGLTAMRRKH